MAGLRKAGSNWVDGDRFLDRKAELDRYGKHFRVWAVTDDPVPLNDVLRVLEHDGYLESWGDDE